MIIKKVKIESLLNSSFCIVPTIQKNELLISWLSRVSYAHHTHPHTFLKLYLGSNSIVSNYENIDVTIHELYIEKIAEKSGKHIAEIYAMSLKRYNGYLQENIIDNGFNKFLTSLRFCPLCLKEDNIPYFRKEWRIVFYTVCLRHQCYLYDTCPKCSNKLKILDMFRNKLSFVFCSHCGYDFRKARKKSLSLKEKPMLNVYKLLHEIIVKGFIQLSSYYIYSFHFLEAIAQITKIILDYKNFKSLDKSLKRNFLKYHFKSAMPCYYQINIKEQHWIFTTVCNLLLNKNDLREYIKVNKLSHWIMIKDMPYISFWYESVITSISPKEINYSKIVTVEEISNAIKYLQKKGIIVNKMNLTRLMGCNFLSSYNQLSNLMDNLK